MGKGLFEGWHIVILILVVVILFGWKRLPDAARGLGRSMRIFKSEVEEMKKDGKSPASGATVKGETVRPTPDRSQDPVNNPVNHPVNNPVNNPIGDPIQDPTRLPVPEPAEREKHNQPPA